MNETVSYTFKRPSEFDLFQIFDCGQCFRFDASESDPKVFEGVAFGKYISVSQTDDAVTIFGADENDFNSVWRSFFALDTSYNDIRSSISSKFGNDKTILSAMECGKGIRILKQDPWETVCSFIISQNNNIPRIKKIIASLSRELGEKIAFGGNEYYAFPSPEALFNAGKDKLFELKTGFRAGYLYDAAQKVVSGELDLDYIAALPTNELMSALMTVKGIGPKVASCIALFGYGKTDAFPIDVWIKRVLEKYYPDGLDISSLGEYAGIAQQYLFYYERYRGSSPLGT